MGVGDYFDTASNEKTLSSAGTAAPVSIVSSPNPSDAKGFVNLADVSCLSSTSCFAVGYYATSLLSTAPLDLKTLVERWNGSTWTIQPSPGATGQAYNALLGVSCTSVSACTAVGSFTNTLLGSPSPLAERWNGTEWSVQTVVPPVAVNDSATVAEDAPATAIGVLANDSEAVAGITKIVAKTDGAHGTVVITGGGTGLTYEPDANYCNAGTADTFTYTLNGGSTATVAVDVTCVDDPPVAVDDTETVDEDAGANAIDVLANDTDIDGGPKAIARSPSRPTGQWAITGGGTGLTYTPDANYCRPPDARHFTYTLQRRLDGDRLRHGRPASTTRRSRSTTPRPSTRTAARTRSTSSATTPTSTAARKSIASVTQPPTAPSSITGGGTGLTYATRRQLLRRRTPSPMN